MARDSAKPVRTAALAGTLYDSEGAREARASLHGSRLAVRVGEEVIGVPLKCLRRGAASALGLTIHRIDAPNWRLSLDRVPPGAWPHTLPLAAAPSRHRPWLAAGLVIAVGACVAGVWGGRDSIVQQIAPLIPHRVSEPIGRSYLAEIGASCDAGNGAIALQKLATRLEQSVVFAEPVSVRVVDVPDVNAVALPGGYIAVYRGLIDQAASADEVAGALAHELAHIARQHPNQLLIRNMGPQVLERVLGSDSSKLASLTVLTHGDRAAEAEADGESIGIMRAARISTADVAHFFERQAVAPQTGSIDFPDSHPSDASRAQRYRDAAMPDGSPALSEPEWQALKSICNRP